MAILVVGVESILRRRRRRKRTADDRFLNLAAHVRAGLLDHLGRVLLSVQFGVRHFHFGLLVDVVRRVYLHLDQHRAETLDTLLVPAGLALPQELETARTVGVYIAQVERVPDLVLLAGAQRQCDRALVRVALKLDGRPGDTLSCGGI